MIPQVSLKRKLKVNCFSKKIVIFWRDMMLEMNFLYQLNYWIKRGKYGIEHDGKVWIYNTLEDWADQLKTSKRSVQRAIQSLKQKGIIKTAYLALNKRDRTLFYTIDYSNFDIDSISKKSKKLSSKISSSDVAKNTLNKSPSDHMVGHMYIYNNNIVNKSYKSQNPIKNNPKNFQNDSKPESEISDNEQKPKNTTVQDMIRELKSEFPNLPVVLNKFLARNLVAAFKLKFKNSITKWHDFLKLIKTSAYLMSEKFHLTLHWLLKFSTIDRLLQGDLGVKLKEIIFSKTEEEKLEEQQKEQEKTEELQQQIDTLDETEKCKNIRKKILQKVGNANYKSWFTKVFLTEENDDVVVNITVQISTFVYDYITNRFWNVLEAFNLTCKPIGELIGC